MCAEVRVERGDEARREVVLRGTHRDARRERGEGLVPDVLVDDVGRLPEAGDVDARLPIEAAEGLGRDSPAIRCKASASG